MSWIFSWCSSLLLQFTSSIKKKCESCRRFCKFRNQFLSLEYGSDEVLE